MGGGGGGGGGEGWGLEVLFFEKNFGVNIFDPHSRGEKRKKQPHETETEETKQNERQFFV